MALTPSQVGGLLHSSSSAVSGHQRISPIRFVTGCHKKQLNQALFVLFLILVLFFCACFVFLTITTLVMFGCVVFFVSCFLIVLLTVVVQVTGKTRFV